MLEAANRVVAYQAVTHGGRNIGPRLRLPSGGDVFRIGAMKSVLGLLVVFYVYVAGPALCLAGADVHACACEEATCPECQTSPCRTAHECHDDPCPDVSRPPEREDLGEHKPSVQCPDSVATTIDSSPGLYAPVSFCCSSSPPALDWHEVFTLEGLPLLI